MTTLTDPTEDQINAAVAEHVAGWAREVVRRYIAEGGWTERHWATSADAVLPLLEKSDRWWTYESANKLMTLWTGGDEQDAEAEGPFPLAACIALLRAKGIQVEFTKEARQ